MKKYTKEEKQAYFQELRDRWKAAKELAETNQFEAAWLEAQQTLGGNFSQTSFIIVKQQLDELGLDGVPYIDTKTFNGWKESGYKVKKGEKSKLSGITWLESDSENEDKVVFPKQYSLFHKSQVEELTN